MSVVVSWIFVYMLVLVSGVPFNFTFFHSHIVLLAQVIQVRYRTGPVMSLLWDMCRAVIEGEPVSLSEILV